MANPRIVWNGNTLDFPEELSDYRPDDAWRGGSNTSDGGVTERVRVGWWREAEILVELFDDMDFFYALQAFHAWASRGKQFSFAFDSSAVVNTTVSGTESVGATVIEVASTAGFVVGGRYLMRSADLLSCEVVEVDTISVGVSVTLAAGTKYAYTAGDNILDVDYYPKAVLVDDTRGFFRLPANVATLRLRFREDRY